MRVLVTRPQAEAEGTADALRVRGHVPVLAPMLAIRFRDAPIPTAGFDALIFTSGNAVAALERQPGLEALLRLPVVAVGARTATAARAAGFGVTLVGGGDARSLAGEIGAGFSRPTRFLHVAGEDRVQDIAELLSPAGHEVAIATAYDAIMAMRFPDEVRDELERGMIGAVTHFSARTAEAFIACADGVVALDGDELRHACLSERVASPLREAGARNIGVAKVRSEAALLDEIAP